MKKQLTTIELFREDLSFAAGHFIIFSPQQRSKLHGHNFQVHASFTTELAENGLTFDYRDYKLKIRTLCQQLNGIFLLPGDSIHLNICEENSHYSVHFNNENIPFLKKDVLILPLRNITVEELARWFLSQLTADHSRLASHNIQIITIKISSAAGVFGSATWNKNLE